MTNAPPPRRVRRHAGARAGQRVRAAARVAAALVPARDVDLRRGRRRRRRSRDGLLGRAAPLHRLHRSRPRGRDAVRRRDRDPRPDARPRRRQPRRGDERRLRLRHRRALRRGARRDHPDDPADRPRVGRAQLRVRLRGGRHARRAARLRPRASASRSRFTFERWNGKGFPTHAEGEAIPLPMRVVHLSHDMEAIARIFSPERARRGRPRSPRPHLRPGAGRPLRRARTARGSPGSPRSIRGTPCSTSSRSRAACSRATSSTRRCSSLPTSST